MKFFMSKNNTDYNIFCPNCLSSVNEMEIFYNKLSTVFECRCEWSISINEEGQYEKSVI